MSLIKCEECENDISDKATTCIHCGCPVSVSEIAGDVVEFSKTEYFDELYSRYSYNKYAAVQEYFKSNKVKYSEAKAIINEEFSKRGYNDLSFWDRLKLQMNAPKVDKNPPVTQEEASTPNNGIEIQKQMLNVQKQQLKLQKKQFKAMAKCPRCGSTSLSGNKKGFRIGKAVVGATLLANPIGLIAGNIGSKKVLVTCMKCGKRFKS